MDYSTLTDEKLMELYQASDKAAFDVLFKRHSSLVYGYLLKQVKNEEMSQDLLQVIFMKLHVYKEKFNSEQPFLPWFFVLVKNTMLDELRKKKPTIEFNEELFSTDPETNYDFDIHEAMTSLNPRYQKVLEMRYIDDLDFDRIAFELNTSSQNIRKMVSRGIRMLKIRRSEGKK